MGLTKANRNVKNRQSRAKLLNVYLIAGDIVVLLDDINLVQEAGRERKTRRGGGVERHVNLPNIPTPIPSQANGNDHPTVKSMGILLVLVTLMT